jgi:DNA-binding NarL/FixJ family response regulator
MRVIIADDAPIFRDYCTRNLTALGVDVVAEAASPSELMSLMRRHLPDAVLLDIDFGGNGREPTDDKGIDAAEQLRADYPQLGIVMISAHMIPAYLERIRTIGPGTHIGYLGKNRIADCQVIVDALERTIAGGIVVDQALADQMLGPRRVRDRLKALPKRQREAMAYLAQGHSNKSIAALMGIELSTVEATVSDVFTNLEIPKSDATNRRVLTVLTWLEGTGILPPDNT